MAARPVALCQLGGFTAATVVEDQWRTPVDAVSDVGHIGRLDDPRWCELDGLVVGEIEAGGVEQTHAVAGQDRGDVELELIEEAGTDHLLQQVATAGDRHVLAVRGGAGLFDGARTPSVT
jgi:hypothetical protein